MQHHLGPQPGQSTQPLLRPFKVEAPLGMKAPTDTPALGLLLNLADRLLRIAPERRQRLRTLRQYGLPCDSISLHGSTGQIGKSQRTVASPAQRSRRQAGLQLRTLLRIQPFGLVQHQQAGLRQHQLLTLRQRLTRRQRRRIEHQQRRLQRQHASPGHCAQLMQQFERMPQAGRLDQQAIRASLTQQPRQPDAKRRAADAAQTATRNLGQGDAILPFAEQRLIQSDLTKFVDQHRPAFICRLMCQQVTNQTGLTSTQRAGDEMSGDIRKHGAMVRFHALRGKAKVAALSERIVMRVMLALLLLSLTAQVWAEACVVHSEGQRVEVKLCQQNRSIPAQLFRDGFCAPQLKGQKVEVSFVEQCPTGAFGECRKAQVQGMPYQQDIHYYGVASDARYLKPACEQQSKGEWVEH